MLGEGFIWVTLQKEGIHKYKDAPDEVSFLRNKHRHIFHFKVHLEIFHDERDVEFIMFKRDIQRYLDSMGKDFNNKSCEMLADDIFNYFKSFNKYEGRTLVVNVSEDNENGIEKKYNIPSQ